MRYIVRLENGELYGTFTSHEGAHRWASGLFPSDNWSIHPLNMVY